MSSTSLLNAIPVLVIAIAVALLVLTILTRQKRLALVASALILANMNWSSVNRITSGVGVSATAILIGIVLVALIVCFQLSFFRVPYSLIRGPGILIFLTLYYISFLSPVVSINPAASLRTSLSFALVCLVGWYAFGKTFSKRPDLARARVYELVYVVGASNLVMLVATAILMGPSARRLEIGGLESRIQVGSFAVSRLQSEGFNATGLAMLAAVALFVIIHWYQRSRRATLRKAWLLVLFIIAAVLLLWTGGRGAILAFVGTASCVTILASLRNRKKAFRNLTLLLLACVCIYLCRGIFVGLFWRGPLQSRVSMSAVDLLLQSRIHDSIAALKYYGDNLLFGSGTGILTRSVFNVESFFFRVLIELGIVGGSIYTLTFLWLTYYVLRVDLHYLRLGQSGAWLPSSVFLFAWIISPVSYGFSLFTGALALQFAIGAGAVVEWDRIRQMRTFAFRGSY